MGKYGIVDADCHILEPPESTILDLLDHLLNKGVMVNGDVTLGVAGIDLIYLRLSALLCAAGYSALDEIHQAFVASRTASAYDSLLDTTGAFAAMGVLWLWFRWRGTPRGVEVATGETPAA